MADRPASDAANEPESLADYFERTKGEKQRSLKKLGHGQGAASVHKLLADAKNAAGDRAVAEAKRGHHDKAKEWSALAVEIDSLLRRSVQVITGV